MTSDGRTLKQLNEMATPGPWMNNAAVGSNGIHTERGMCIALTHMDDKVQRHADAAFIVAVVNAYREGRLVEAPPKQTCTHGNSPHCYPFCYEPDPSSVTETPK